MLKVIRRRLNPSLEPSPPTRISLLPIGHLSLPSLRWWDGDKIPTHHKSPLLDLKLSSHSFLDCSIEDDLSTALYTIKTTDASTTVIRSGGDPLNVATIKWPGRNEAREDDQNYPLIQMRGCRWTKEQAFLRSESNPDSSRKFIIPDCSNSMKWKLYGTSYWCTTSGVKGPIATLDLANGWEPMRLTIYETLRDKYDPQALLAYNGVSLLLLDYLVVTALLCVTDVSAWMKFCDVIHAAKSGNQKLDYVPRFPNHPYAKSGDLDSIPSGSSSFSSDTTASVPAKLTSRLHHSRVLTESDSWCSKRYSDTSVIEDWSKDYLAFLHSMSPSSSVEALQLSGIPPSPASVRLLHKSSLPFLPMQLRPRANTSPHPEPSSRLPDQPQTSIHPFPLPPQLPKPSLSHHARQPHGMRIHSSLPPSQQSPLGLETKKISPSEQLAPNISKPTHVHCRSESFRRPLPKPPTPSGVRRIQSAKQSNKNSPTNSSLMTSRTRHTRLLPPIPLIKASELDESRTTVSEENGRIQHARSPPITKASQEDLSQRVDELTSPLRVLPPIPLPKTVVFDLPPSYTSVYSPQRPQGDRKSTPTLST